MGRDRAGRDNRLSNGLDGGIDASVQGVWRFEQDSRPMDGRFVRPRGCLHVGGNSGLSAYRNKTEVTLYYPRQRGSVGHARATHGRALEHENDWTLRIGATLT